MGLDNVDFDKIKFITITAEKKNIIESGQVTKGDHLRIRIQQDFSPKYISEKEAEDLKKFSDATTVESGNCPSSSCQNSKTSLKEDLKKSCNNCSSKASEMWVCNVNPARHCYCDECYQALSKQRLYEKAQKK